MYTAIKRHRDLFAYDFSKKCIEDRTNFKMLNEALVWKTVDRLFEKMGVKTCKRFKLFEISD